MDNNKQSEEQDFVDDFWDTFSPEEKEMAIGEGFLPPTKCEFILVDFKSRQLMGRWYL